MTPKNDKAKERPFPWPCFRCHNRTVVPAVTAYSTQVKYDGVLYAISLPEWKVPICSNCGEMVVTAEAEDQITAVLRAHLRLLTPSEIVKGIGDLGLKQKEFADRLGVAEETVSRWVNAIMIQSRAMDNLMRVFFAIPEVRAVLRGSQASASITAPTASVQP